MDMSNPTDNLTEDFNDEETPAIAEVQPLESRTLFSGSLMADLVSSFQSQTGTSSVYTGDRGGHNRLGD